MTENKSQMVLFQGGVFVPVEFNKAMEELNKIGYVGLDVSKYQQPIEGLDTIDPLSLHLISSRKPIERRIQELEKNKTSNLVQMDDFNSQMLHYSGLNRNIIAEAQRMADEVGVPYFAVSTDFGMVQSPADFSENLFKNQLYSVGSFQGDSFARDYGKIIEEPKLVERIVQPTVDLYILKK